MSVFWQYLNGYTIKARLCVRCLVLFVFVNREPEPSRPFLELYLAQLTPRIVRNVYSGYGGEPHVLTTGDKLNMMMDYRDVLEHDASTLRDVFGPLQAP